MVRLRAALCAWLLLGCAWGCMAPLPRDVALHHLDEQAQSATASHHPPQPVDDQFPSGHSITAQAKDVYGPPTIEQVRATESKATVAPTVEDTKALGIALAELEAQGAIDSATQAQLLDGLKQTDPALWPQLLAYFRSAARNRRELAKTSPVAEIELVADTEPTTPAPSNKAEPAPPKPSQDEPADKKAEKPPTETKKTKPKAAKAKLASAKLTKARRESNVSDKSKSEPSDADWQQSLATSISKLEKQTAQAPTNNSEIGQHVALRMLYLTAGRRDDALKAIEGISPAQQDFWSKELYGLAACLDHTRNPDASRRAAEANTHLRDATARLGELATLQIRNLAFCTEVTSYGVYKPFDVTDFQAGQEALLYAEIENFKSEHTERGYHTAFKASYQILDERGARVDEKEFAITEEHCQNPRRDFFIRYFIWMPQRIYGGKYTLQLSVEDTLSQKIGQASLEFKIKGK